MGKNTNKQHVTSKPTADWQILLIDDDEDDYLIARSHLNRAGGHKVQIEWASSYNRGMECLETNSYDAVLVDYDLGERTGIEFIRKAAASNHKIPLILYTSRGSYETDIEAMEAGADMYLTKMEITPLILERSIRYAINQKRMEESLRESEARLRALITAAHSYAAYRMSPDWSEMTHLKSTDFLANTEKPDPKWEEKYILAEDRPNVMAVIKEAIRTKSMFNLEHRVLLADGSVGWTSSKAVPIFNSQGEIYEWFGVALDISEKKRAEEELRLYQEQFGDISPDP
jgi:DNA-binding response OmpR family regulator